MEIRKRVTALVASRFEQVVYERVSYTRAGSFNPRYHVRFLSLVVRERARRWCVERGVTLRRDLTARS